MNNVAAVYITLALLEIGILEYVIRQVDFDRINNLDPAWVRWARRMTFSGGELFLCFTMYAIGWLWDPTWFDVGLLAAGCLILAVNIVSLHLRAPPSPGHGYRTHMAYTWLRGPINSLNRITRRE